MKFIGLHFLVARLRSTTRAKRPPIASSSRHRPGTQTLAFDNRGILHWYK
jgi:hypothetical protein